MQRDREPSLIKPSDLAQEPYVHTLFEGDIEGLRQWMEAMSAHPYIVSIEDYRNGLSPETKKTALCQRRIFRRVNLIHGRAADESGDIKKTKGKTIKERRTAPLFLSVLSAEVFCFQECFR